MIPLTENLYSNVVIRPGEYFEGKVFYTYFEGKYSFYTLERYNRDFIAKIRTYIVNLNKSYRTNYFFLPLAF